MKIEFTVELIGYDGEPVSVPSEDGTEMQHWTLGRVCCEALMAMFQDEPDLSGTEKLNRHYLAAKIHRSKRPVKLTAEDVALLKRLVAKLFGPKLVGPVWLLLEGKPMELELDEPDEPASDDPEPVAEGA